MFIKKIVCHAIALPAHVREERVEGPAARQMRPMHEDARAPPLVAAAAGWFCLSLPGGLQTELRLSCCICCRAGAAPLFCLPFFAAF